VIIEGNGAVGDVDMAADEITAGPYPFGVKTVRWRVVEKDPGQYVASSVTKKNTVGQVPPPDGVTFYSGPKPVHCGASIDSVGALHFADVGDQRAHFFGRDLRLRRHGPEFPVMLAHTF